MFSFVLHYFWILKILKVTAWQQHHYWDLARCHAAFSPRDTFFFDLYQLTCLMRRTTILPEFNPHSKESRCAVWILLAPQCARRQCRQKEFFGIDACQNSMAIVKGGSLNQRPLLDLPGAATCTLPV